MKKIALSFNKVTKKYFKGGHYQPTLREWAGAIFTGKSFQRPQFKALNQISFAVQKGEVVGIVGSNGAGKSTILKMALKITFPNEGSVTINGTATGLLELNTGFHPELTGNENVYLYGSILGLSKERLDLIYPHVVKFSGLKGFMDMPIKHYSSGMLARLGFSIAIHVEPDILLIDEILSVGDLAFQEKCMKFMKNYCRNPNHTVVFVSHLLENIRAICTRVIWMEHGKVVESGKTNEVLKRYIKFQRGKNE
ncbi:hypothetical protein A2160_02510 [Candidatus Beckwithbacteria bacterium RBG_13_42_9]|uniref:ABC transporter domain-containing protein n=1 Tax=Candidatus Beckwithbacteria bacterium RBG_13_42_9 TaxID=1797457 RepID=A0A1F5E7V9_9BACT|nr:MAG: hypothetical protein A2160_02510 [Candidatus Beckwithbacteria bacterium RBG_13_42_9]